MISNNNNFDFRHHLLLMLLVTVGTWDGHYEKNCQKKVGIVLASFRKYTKFLLQYNYLNKKTRQKGHGPRIFFREFLKATFLNNLLI